MTTLTHRLATSATGYGAIIDGILNICTVTDTANAAALNALYFRGFQVQSTCRDRDCDCIVKTLARLAPDVRIVPVSVQTTDTPKVTA
jgi:hypothetical protein